MGVLVSVHGVCQGKTGLALLRFHAARPGITFCVYRSDGCAFTKWAWAATGGASAKTEWIRRYEQQWCNASTKG